MIVTTPSDPPTLTPRAARSLGRIVRRAVRDEPPTATAGVLVTTDHRAIHDSEVSRDVTDRQ